MIDFLKNIYFQIIKAVLFGLVLFIVFYFSFKEYKNWAAQKDFTYGIVDDGLCNIAVIPVGGSIGIKSTSSHAGEDGLTKSDIAPMGDIDRVISDLELAKNSDYIRAVVLQIDSFGGSMPASEVLFNYLKKYPKPIVSYMRDAGVSGGYLISLPTNRIFSGRTTQVGSIGVISSTLNNSEKNKKDGIEYIQISSGKYKDGLNPDKELSDEEIKLERDQVNSLADVFKSWVSEYRKLPLETVNTLADGRTWSGDEALKLGLIDEIGDMATITKYFEGKLLMDEGKVIPCGYNTY